MKVGVLGSGEVAKTLATGFLKHGHQVTVGSRTPAKLRDWARQNPAAATASFSGAAESGEVIVLAVKGRAAAEVLRSAGENKLAGKTIIDACNPAEDAPPDHGVLRLYTSHDKSLMEQLQKEFTGAHFVKAFSSVGANFMVDPDFGGVKPTMFICGNNEGAKKSVSSILDQFGWETADMGTAEAARAIEPLCMLWCLPGFLRNEWTHAFKLLRK
jgi:predicted dinucleotide-binding enzyme